MTPHLLADRWGITTPTPAGAPAPVPFTAACPACGLDCTWTSRATSMGDGRQTTETAPHCGRCAA